VESWIRRPTAWLPFLISIVALAFVDGYAATSGGAAHQEEHAPARTFQLLMLAEAILVVVFAARWLPKAPKRAAQIVAAQVLAASIPTATVIYLEALG
jgi:hypothetical protein